MTPAGRKYAHVNSSSRVQTSLTGLPAALASRAASMRRFAGVLAAVARTHVGHDHAYAFGWNAQRASQFAAHAEGSLRSCPDGQLVIGPFGHSGPRLEGHMSDVGDGVSCS